MFDSGFATLFRAVDRIRLQLETADHDLKQYLAEELVSIQRLGEQYIDHWVTLDEQIGELLESFELQASPETPSYSAFSLKPARADTEFAADAATSGLVQTDEAVDVEASAASLQSLEGDDSFDWESIAFNLTEPVTIAFRKGLAYYDLSMFEAATESFTAMLRQTESPMARLYLASSLFSQNRVAESLHHLNSARLLTDDPLFQCAADEIEAEICLREQKVEEAIQLLLQISRQVPQYDTVWYNLGVCYAVSGNYLSAEAMFREALRQTPGDGRTLQLLATVQLRLGNFSRAKATCKTGLNQHPYNKGLLLLSAMVAKAVGEFQSAAEICSDILRLYPDCQPAWTLSVWLYVVQTQWDRAVTTLKRELTLHRNHPQALLQLGVVYLLAGQLDPAERTLLRCFPANEHKSLLWIALGRISALKGNFAQAHTRFARAMRDQRKPIRRLALYSYATLLLDFHRDQEAETYLKAALLLGPPNPAIYAGLAVTAKRQGRVHEAQKLADRAKHCQSQSFGLSP